MPTHARPKGIRSAGDGRIRYDMWSCRKVRSTRLRVFRQPVPAWSYSLKRRQGRWTNEANQWGFTCRDDTNRIRPSGKNAQVASRRDPAPGPPDSGRLFSRFRFFLPGPDKIALHRRIIMWSLPTVSLADFPLCRDPRFPGKSPLNSCSLWRAAALPYDLLPLPLPTVQPCLRSSPGPSRSMGVYGNSFFSPPNKWNL